MKYSRKKRLTPQEYINGILLGDRIILSKAITLVESNLEDDNLLAEKVLEEIWNIINEHHVKLVNNEYFEYNRTQQNIDWMHEIITYALKSGFYNHPDIRKNIIDRENKVKKGCLPAIIAAKQLLEMLK